ncbi:MAG: FliG C-terminal domain-containing protein [Deltaproteobacteria bacterium]|nr:FliG C-terminal domain-containing protein [Deltaproteobacteria bacterium]
MRKRSTIQILTALLLASGAGGALLGALAASPASAQPGERYAEVFSEKLKIQRDLRERLQETLSPLAEPFHIYVSVSVEAKAEVRKLIDKETTPGMQVDMGSGESFKLPGLPTVQGTKLKGSPKVNITVPSRESISTRETIQAKLHAIKVEVRHQPGITEERLAQMHEVAVGVAGLDLTGGDSIVFVEMARNAAEEVELLFAPDLIPVIIICLTILLSTFMLAMAIGRRKVHTTETAGAGGGAGPNFSDAAEIELEGDPDATGNGAIIGHLGTGYFGFVSELNHDQQVELFATLEPQVAAIVIDCIGVAAGVLREAFEQVEEKQKLALIRAMAEPRKVETARIEAMEAEVQATVDQIKSRIKIGSAASATEILALTSSDDTRAILEAIGAENPALAEQLRSGLVLFEDVPGLPVAQVRTAVAAADPHTVAVALRGADPAIRKAILESVSKRLAAFLESEEQYLGEVSEEQVEEARLQFEAHLRSSGSAKKPASAEASKEAAGAA